eukprot:TRINITY_DN5079_c0_g3_i1.p2 TRINITY_DN5079_c0_g3~~TRINITY_DN5079_c0_g3_i1.p2  ORF type:complete len:297 (+),score=33.66 TRINITY_DN5079_c0_g3_i1:47-892(+)
MSKGGGPNSRTLPQREGVSGHAAAALGRLLTAGTQAGPIRYTSGRGAEYCTVDYLAMDIQGPKNVKELIAPLIAQGAKVTFGSTHEPLKGWNLVVDVSETREEARTLPNRVDQIADCLRKENVDHTKTVFLAFYTGVGAGMDMYGSLSQTARTVKRFHMITVHMKNIEMLSSWTSPKSTPPPASTGRGGAGKGNRGRGGGAGTAGASANAKRNTEIIQKQIKGRVAGSKGKGAFASKGGKGSKGTKGGKGAKTTHLGDGLTKRVNKGGQVTFAKSSGYVPY